MRKNSALVNDPLTWWDKYVIRQRIPSLSIRTAPLRALAKLPNLHKDPFDRILVGQSLAEELTLVSNDALLARYGVFVVW